MDRVGNLTEWPNFQKANEQAVGFNLYELVVTDCLICWQYLTKQTAALREVNDSRLRIYEQLEISIQDLERNNQRLVQENMNDKKQIKSLYETIESLESRCEDLQHLIDDMGHLKKNDCAISEGSSAGGSVIEDQDEYVKLVTQLEHAKNQRAKEQRKVSELEQNVSLLIQENTSLEEKVCVMQQKDEELKTLQDQIVYLEEMRQGNQLCRRCQRSTDPNQLFDEYSVYDDDDDADDISAIGSYVETHKHEVLQQLQETLGKNYSEDNPYRILVDKYEALLKNQQKHNAFTGSTMPSSTYQDRSDVSLQEELQMSGQFSSFNGNASEDSDDENDGGKTTADNDTTMTTTTTGKRRTIAAAADNGNDTMCKYSETETASSSGFSDETSNKCTQTETFFTGSFLCTISDGDDCRFSIYDDASPVESRFRNTPEYHQLFREIFAVLKRAAVAKDEGKMLPLLQDDEDENRHGLHRRGLWEAPKVPPVTPACEHNPLVVSSVETAAADGAVDVHAVATAESERQQLQDGAVPQQQQERTARRRDIIEELATTVKPKKHVRQHHRKSASKQQQSRDISHLMDFKWTDQMTRRPRNPSAASPSHRATWCAPRDDEDDATSSGGTGDHQRPAGRENAPYASSASQDVAKLKLLEMSYAEVLRLRKPSSNRPQSQYFKRM